jgi:hypothetical protein
LRGANNTECENYEFEFHRFPLPPSSKPQNAAAATIANVVAGSSGSLLPPSPPAKKTTARQDQARKSRAWQPRLHVHRGTGFRRIRRIMTPLGFTTRQITNAYRVHEPARGLGLLATLVFATESNSWTASGNKVLYEEQGRWLDRANPLHQALARLGNVLEAKKGAAPDGAAKGLTT